MKTSFLDLPKIKANKSVIDLSLALLKRHSTPSFSNALLIGQIMIQETNINLYDHYMEILFVSDTETSLRIMPREDNDRKIRIDLILKYSSPSIKYGTRRLMDVEHGIIENTPSMEKTIEDVKYCIRHFILPLHKCFIQ